jgi:uncharacterized short protein YbdD (DUF466 family)
MKQRLIDLWKLMRALATDDAYERYLAHHAQAHDGERLLSRREFYLGAQQRKWTGVSRCC